MKEANSIRVVTVVDNNVWKEGLTSSWGISFLVEVLYDDGKQNVLMDTSGSYQTFFDNASKLSIDLSTAQGIFISHWHGDHCGSLSHILPLLRRPIPVFVPSEHSWLKKIVNAGGRPTVCSKPTEFLEVFMSTGSFGFWLKEHSLIMKLKDEGLVVLTGCAHPGITRIVGRAIEIANASKVYAVIGGFHISSRREGERIGGFLRRLDAKVISPCHCTSTDAKQAIASVVGDAYVENGSGRIIDLCVAK
ncbi:MBL fold metallo-hydrolase [Candidatus Bathyarchaeota archaeon]|nr:MBL fold metallo-hydrolase [Candidatus Bathyarchaeota archaeon]